MNDFEKVMRHEIQQWLLSEKDENLVEFNDRMKRTYGSKWRDYFQTREPDESTRQLFQKLMGLHLGGTSK